MLAHLLRTLTVHGDADGFLGLLARRLSGLAGSAGARVGAWNVGGVGAAAADADGAFDDRKLRRPCGVIVASTSTHSASDLVAMSMMAVANGSAPVPAIAARIAASMLRSSPTGRSSIAALQMIRTMLFSPTLALASGSAS